MASRSTMLTSPRFVAGALVALMGCTGQIGDAGEPDPEASDPGAPGAQVGGGDMRGGTAAAPRGSCSLGPNPMRRLTVSEYNNTVHDLLGLPAVDVRRTLLTDVS